MHPVPKVNDYDSPVQAEWIGPIDIQLFHGQTTPPIQIEIALPFGRSPARASHPPHTSGQPAWQRWWSLTITRDILKSPSNGEVLLNRSRGRDVDWTFVLAQRTHALTKAGLQGRERVERGI